MNMMKEVQERRAEELQALQAYYGSDIRGGSVSLSSEDISLEGPWFLLIQQTTLDVDDDNAARNNNSSLGIPTLEMRLPSSYPLGEECPEPILHNIMMKPELKKQLIEELKDMYEVEMDVGIMWGERCREELLHGELKGVDADATNENDDTNGQTDTSEGVATYNPPTTRYSQPIRNFPLEIISNAKYQRQIIHTPPFHPPKSGPSETMIAHVCTVTCMEHIQWALADLLLNDKKVAKASHNMFAYRFTNEETGTLVSDNDDDGEKGSGSKLASLLDMCNVDNVLVVVSRWFGGIHLGPARFKWIAWVAREGLVQGGYLER